MYIIDFITSRFLLIFSEISDRRTDRQTEISGNIKFPETLQPYRITET